MSDDGYLADLVKQAMGERSNADLRQCRRLEPQDHFVLVVPQTKPLLALSDARIHSEIRVPTSKIVHAVHRRCNPQLTSQFDK